MQMKKYRSDENKPPSENQVKADRQTNPWLYYVNDLESNEEGDISISEHSFEEEYTSFVTLPRSTATDPVKYWQVNLPITIIHYSKFLTTLLG